MFGFKLSVQADLDVYKILDYTIDTWGVEQAEKYQLELEVGRLSIQENPNLLGSKSRDDLLKGCRSFRVNHHYFFYRINENDHTIEIARILHESMNFELHIKGTYFPQ